MSYLKDKRPVADMPGKSDIVMIVVRKAVSKARVNKCADARVSFEGLRRMSAADVVSNSVQNTGYVQGMPSTISKPNMSENRKEPNGQPERRLKYMTAMNVVGIKNAAAVVRRNVVCVFHILITTAYVNNPAIGTP